jgi:hypothetical protein
VALAVIASACSTIKPVPTVRTVIVRPTVPAAARQPCAAPVRLPDRDLSAIEVTTNWGRDRAALKQCEARRAAAVRAIEGQT